AQFGEDLVSMFAPFGGGLMNAVAMAVQGKGRSDKMQLAKLIMPDGRRQVEVLYLRILKHLIDSVYRAAGHAGICQVPDPVCGRSCTRHLTDQGVEFRL